MSEPAMGAVYRLQQPVVTVVAAVAGTVVGTFGFVAILLGWFGAGLAERAEEHAAEVGMPASPELLALAVVGICLVLLVFVGRGLVYQIQVHSDGALELRTVLRALRIAPGDAVALDEILGVLRVSAVHGQVFLLPELAHWDELVAHLDAAVVRGDRAAGAGGLAGPPPEPLPRVALDTSVRRIVRTDTFAFGAAVYGLGAGAIILITVVVAWWFGGAAAVRPDGTARPLSEWIATMGAASLMPPLMVLPVVLYRVARWRAILDRGEPVLGRIDGVDNTSGERLVRFSFDWAGRRHRIKLLVRPTPEVKALQAGAPEVLWVRPDHPRKALPQGLFVPRET